MEQKLRVTQVKGVIGQCERTRKIMAGLGLRKIGLSREFKDNNCIRGMVNKVRHLVKYEIVQA